jgi:hypothetical protein
LPPETKALSEKSADVELQQNLLDRDYFWLRSK